MLSAGGCYLPCDPSYPDDRLAVYLEDGAAVVVLASAEHTERAKAMVGAGVPVIDVSSLLLRRAVVVLHCVALALRTLPTSSSPLGPQEGPRVLWYLTAV